METRVFCVELKMGPSGHMDSTGIFPDSNTREFGPRRTTQRQPPRPTHKCNAPRLPFHVHLTHDLTRAASALPLHTAALAFVSFGIVLVQVQVAPCNFHVVLMGRVFRWKNQCAQGAVPIGQRAGPRGQLAVCLVSAHCVAMTTTLIYTFIIPSGARTSLLLSVRGYASGGS